MANYSVSILVRGQPVMCDTIEAPNAAEARTTWAAQFWNACDGLRAALPEMNDLNRNLAEQMLSAMDATREEARQFGIEVTARLSRAKIAA